MRITERVFIMFFSTGPGAFLKRGIARTFAICLLAGYVLLGVASPAPAGREHGLPGNGNEPGRVFRWSDAGRTDPGQNTQFAACSHFERGRKENGKDANMATPMEVTHRIWGERYPTTPELEGGDSRLGFQAVPGRSMAGDTVVLTGAYVASSPILDYYGGQLPGAIHLVAFDPETGVVHNHPLLDAKSPPVRVLVPEGVKPAPGGSVQKAAFDVDMPSLLALPPEATTYRVFFWLDNVVSPVVSVEVPENKNRTLFLLSNRRSPDLIDFKAGLKTQTPPSPSSIALEAVVADGAKTVCGAWTPGPGYDPAKPYFLALIALNHRDRSCGWTSVDVNDLPRDNDKWRFRFDPPDLTGLEQGTQSVFVAAFSSEHAPVVLEVEP